jgi:hypothetical protein
MILINFHFSDQPSTTVETLIPALGESFSHAASSRIWFDFAENGNSPKKVRTVKLVKSPRVSTSWTESNKFVITKTGIINA